MKSAAGLGFGVAVASFMLACGMASQSVEPPIPGGDSGPLTPDSATAEAGTASRRIVVVNAITETNGAYEGVVICIGGANPMPATAMPLTNYPGIPVGGGVDLGSANASGSSVDLDVFDAKTVQSLKDDCAVLRDTFPTDYTRLSVTLKPSPINVVALVTDGAKPKHLGARQVAFADDGTYVPDRVQGYLANLSAAPGPTALDVAGKVAAAATVDGAVSPRFEVSIDESATFKVTHAGGTVSQSMRSVQYASDPTRTTAGFFAVRQSFLFALVGDPAIPFDPNAPAQDLTGRELHVVAIPFGDGVQ